MGFYQPAQLVRDAREHKVEVREADVNHSDWDCTLELPSPRLRGEGQPETAAPASAPHPNPLPVETGRGSTRAALRLGLRLISGLAEAEANKIAESRNAGYTRVSGLWTRTGASFATLERLAAADTFRSIGLDRRAALWEVRGLGVALPDSGTMKKSSAKSLRSGASLLDGPDHGDLFDEPRVALPAMAKSEHVAEDYVTTGLSLKAHPCQFFRNDLTSLGVITSETHREERWRRQRVAVAGLVLVRQRPGTAKGVVFLTMEDETGIVNVIVWPKVFERNRRIVMSSQFLLVRGRLEREGLVIHVVAEELLDLTPRLGELSAGEAELRTPARTVGEGSWKSKSRDFH